MSVIDPSGFQINARMKTGDNKVYNLWLGGAADDANTGGQGFFRGAMSFVDLPIVSSIEYEMGMGYNGKISISIQATYEMGLALLESQLFTIGNICEVQIGYPRIGLFTPWFGGMNAKPSIRLAPDEGLTATLNIEGGGFSAVRSTASRQFQGQSYLQVIQSICDDHGLLLRTDPRDLAQQSDDPMNVQRDIPQGNQTDWVFMMGLVRSGLCDAYLQPDREESGRTALLVSKRTNMDRPRVRFNARGDADFFNVFPLFSFESEAPGVWLPRGSGTVRTNDISPDDRSEDNEVEVAPASTDATHTGEAVVAEGGRQVGDHRVEARAEPTETRTGERLPVSSRDFRTPGAVAQSHSQEQQRTAAIEANISTIGLPHVFPNDYIEIINFGIFGGVYKIESLTHRAEPGQWTTSMKLIANATNLDALNSILANNNVQNVNNQEAEQSEEAGSGGEISVEPEDPEGGS